MKKTYRYALIILGLVAVGCGLALQITAAKLVPLAKQRIVRTLEDRFDADVSLGDLSITLFPSPEIQGQALEIRHRDWPDAHPLIRIRRFAARAGFVTLLLNRNTVRFVRLDGLEIHIPPRGKSVFTRNKLPQEKTSSRFMLEDIQADGALLEIQPEVPGKDPLQFQIKSLRMKSVGAGQPMAFRTELINAKPTGLVSSSGSFGPWQEDDPRATAVSGDYTLDAADLSVFKGIRGMLSSTGKYQGTLQHIEADGTADIPDFSLKRGGDPVRLDANFHSIINGSDGDTILDPVIARFRNSQFVCRGSVARRPGQTAKTVTLDASANRARIEDILLLVLGQRKALLTGSTDFDANIVIPPGREEVASKLHLKGRFSVASAKFTSSKLQQKLNVLSERSRGISAQEEGDVPPETAASNFKGQFELNHGQMTFSALSFDVPGASILLKGGYNLDSQKIDMNGIFRMVATLSETQSGIRHMLLKLVDPLFKKNGAGFQVPIFIAGDRDHPELGVEVFRKEFRVK